MSQEFNIGTIFKVIKDLPARRLDVPDILVGQIWTVYNLIDSALDGPTFKCGSIDSPLPLMVNTCWWPEWSQHLRVIGSPVNTSAVNAMQTLRRGPIEVVLCV